MQPKLDLHFPNTHDLKTLGIVDISMYPSNFTVSHPTIEIIPPSLTQKNLRFHTNALNIFNSNHLGLTCGTCGYTELPDGIWYVKYSIAPAAENYVERTFLRIDKLRTRLEDVFMCIDIDECNTTVKEDKLEWVDQIEVYIQGAISAANKCNNSKAMKLYNIASKMIENLLKKC